MSEPVFVIAEAGVNHNGELVLAHQLVEAAARAGADAVKFQTFRAGSLVSRSAPKAAYQKQHTDAAESQLEMIRRLELSPEAHFELKRHCDELDITFLSSPFDSESADFLVNDLEVERLKIPSGEITNGPLLLHVARLGVPLILSTGMSTLEEVEHALIVLAHGIAGRNGPPDRGAFEDPAIRSQLRRKITLLHCTTEYPAPPQEVNLRAMDTLADAFDLPVGYSDHTQGILVSVIAVARGARVIEKHFTLDCTMEGPDHAASLEPDGLMEMVSQIRLAGEVLGDGKKVPAGSELKNIAVARKSLVAARPIKEGERYSAQNLACKRPAEGLSPMDYWLLLGQAANRDYAEDEAIEP